MPTTINILSKTVKQRAFNAPPKFITTERQAYFELTPDAQKYLRTLRTVDNKLNFIIQYGYFSAKGRFFEASMYREIDIKYIHRIYGFPASSVPMDTASYQVRYGGASSLRHRQKILEFKGWKVARESDLKILRQFAGWQAEKQASPETQLWALVDHCWKMQWVITNYDVLCDIVSKSYNQFESVAVDKVREQLSSLNKSNLEQLIESKEKNLSLLAKTKHIDQSTKTKCLKQNAEYLAMYKDFFMDNEILINNLKLTDSALTYYSHWVKKAKVFQLNQFRNRNKSYLYLLAFIQHQFYLRQDAAVAGFLSTIRKSINRANKKAEEFERKNNAEKNKAIDAVSDSQKRLTQLVSNIILVVDDSTLTEKRKLEIIRNQAISMLDSHDDAFVKKVDFLDKYREKEKKDLIFIKALIEQSRSLSLAIGKTLQLLVFDESSASLKLLEAIQYYQQKQGKITQYAPTKFLVKKEKEAIFQNDKFNVPLYKMFLYRHIVSQIKSGELSLQYSYEYLCMANGYSSCCGKLV